MMKINKLIVILFMSLFLAFHAQSQDYSQIETLGIVNKSKMKIEVSTARVIRFVQPLEDIFIADSNIADTEISGFNTLYIHGIRPGQTTIIAYGRNQQILRIIDLTVNYNISAMQQAIEESFPQVNINIIPTPLGVLLKGSVPNPITAETIKIIISHYLGVGQEDDEGGEDGETTRISRRIIDNMVIDSANQINLRVKIAEFTREARQAFSFNMEGVVNPLANLAVGAGTGRDFLTAQDADAASEGLGAGQIIQRGTSSGGDSLGALYFSRVFDSGRMGFLLEALENQGLASIMAEPNLTALSGETATFLAGGEIPIPLADEENRVTVEFKRYGVFLAFTPIILNDGKISMRVNTEVSDIAKKGEIRIQNLVLPGISTRRTETTIEMASGQSFAIAGLLNNQIDVSAGQMPWLAELPIIGALFKSDSFLRRESELMVIVTPYIVKPTREKLQDPTTGFLASRRSDRILFGKLSEKTKIKSSKKPIHGTIILHD